MSSFDLDKKKRGVTRHERMLQKLAESGIVTRAPVEKITETVMDVLKQGAPVKVLNDSEKIYEAVYRII